MKKLMKRADLDLKVIFEGLLGDNFSQALEQEIAKLGSIIKNEEEAELLKVFSFLLEEVK